MAIGIVKTEKGYEAKENDVKQPLFNLVLEVPDNKAINSNQFFIVATGVTVSWNNYYGTSRWRIIEVLYKDVIVFEKNAVKNIQVVIDVLDKFSNISENELNHLFQESIVKEKSTLEKEIEELRIEKDQLEKKVDIYKEIKIKAEEFKDLLAKL